MIYQFSGFLLLLVIGLDLLLIGLIVLSTQLEKRVHQRVLLGLSILGFVGFGLFKSLFTTPDVIASTPVALEVKTASFFKTLYYLGKSDEKVFWKEYVVGGSKGQSLDLESNAAGGLIVATKFDGDWYSLEMALASGKVNKVIVDKYLFFRATQSTEDAIRNYT